jgi:hypothetical protein
MVQLIDYRGFLTNYHVASFKKIIIVDCHWCAGAIGWWRAADLFKPAGCGRFKNE